MTLAALLGGFCYRDHFGDVTEMITTFYDKTAVNFLVIFMFIIFLFL